MVSDREQSVIIIDRFSVNNFFVDIRECKVFPVDNWTGIVPYLKSVLIKLIKNICRLKKGRKNGKFSVFSLSTILKF